MLANCARQAMWACVNKDAQPRTGNTRVSAFEALAVDCAEDGVSEFLLVAAPEPIVGATSAPVVPIATK